MSLTTRASNFTLVLVVPKLVYSIRPSGSAKGHRRIGQK